MCLPLMAIVFMLYSTVQTTLLRLLSYLFSGFAISFESVESEGILATIFSRSVCEILKLRPPFHCIDDYFLKYAF